MTTLLADVLIVGGGIAGLSLAAELAGRCRVVLIERESALAQHSSGRSAQQMQPSYGPPPVRALTTASLPLVEAIEEQVGRRILIPRPLVWCDTQDDPAALTALLAQVPNLRRAEVAEALADCPALRPGAVHAAAFDDDAREVDVPALVAHAAARAQAAGATLLREAPVHTAERSDGPDGVWRVRAGQYRVEAAVVVDAAGAWADDVARLFGARPRALVPYRRTVAILACERPIDPAWPMVGDVADTFYLRPYRAPGSDRTDLLTSPAEEVATAACDAQPIAADVEALVLRIAAVVDVGRMRVVTSWTGLRTFPADHLPVVGFDAETEGFFWLAGQGGYGIQTSAALARACAASLLAGGSTAQTSAPSGLRSDVEAAVAEFSPQRAALAR